MFEESHQVLMNLCTNAARAMREKGGFLLVGLPRVQLPDHGFGLSAHSGGRESRAMGPETVPETHEPGPESLDAGTRAAISSLEPGAYVRLAVSDTATASIPT
jgi:signal transduction histidine kinase